MADVETVWVVIANDGIDEPDRVVCFTLSGDDAVRAADTWSTRDPLYHPDKNWGTQYRCEPVQRWPDTEQRAREQRERDTCAICGKLTRGGHERDGTQSCWGHDADDGDPASDT